MAASATDEGKSMYDWLIDMYLEFGYYKETLLNITKKGPARRAGNKIDDGKIPEQSSR